MINWFNLFANSLWILALSVALAVLSYARWEAKHTGNKLKDVINQPAKQILFNVCGMFFSAGLAMTAGRMWEQVLWGLMGGLFLLQIGLAYVRPSQD